MRHRTLLSVILLLSLLGLVISLYLADLYLFGGIIPCGPSGSCEIVRESPYAWLLGVPIPIWGAVAYGGITGLAVWGLARRRLGEWGGLSLFGLGLAGLLFAGYLTYLELFVIHAICRWCVGSAVIMLALFLCTLPLLRSGREEL